MQSRPEVKHAVPSVPKSEPDTCGTNHFAPDEFRNRFHVSSIMAKVQFAAMAVVGEPDSIGVGVLAGVGAPIQSSKRRRVEVGCRSTRRVSGCQPLPRSLRTEHQNAVGYDPSSRLI